MTNTSQHLSQVIKLGQSRRLSPINLKAYCVVCLADIVYYRSLDDSDGRSGSSPGVAVRISALKSTARDDIGLVSSASYYGGHLLNQA